jgi:hypothetical protein
LTFHHALVSANLLLCRVSAVVDDRHMILSFFPPFAGRGGLLSMPDCPAHSAIICHLSELLIHSMACASVSNSGIFMFSS